MKRCALVFPTSWDRKQIELTRTAAAGSLEIDWGTPTDEDCPWNFDVVTYIDDLAESLAGRVQGVWSSSDYPGATVAAAVATRLGLPGSRPESVLGASHKFASRCRQREAAPEATPGFDLLDPDDPAGEPTTVGYPCFVKPVKGAFSIMSGKIGGPQELRDFFAHPAVSGFRVDYVRMFNALVRTFTDFEIDGRFFLAEEFLHGRQVTVEGWEHTGRIEIMGIVDSVTYPGTSSFARFDYPSTSLPEIQARMADVARRVASRLDLRSTLFNIEMIHEPVSDRISIVEVNPRVCGQFADLYAKVDGTSGYDVALDLAFGEVPTMKRSAGKYAMATSFPLRVFDPVRVVRAPGSEDVAAAEALFPGTLVWSECEIGQTLADFREGEDGQSARYAVVNLGADSREELLSRLEAVRSRLDYRFEPVR